MLAVSESPGKLVKPTDSWASTRDPDCVARPPSRGTLHVSRPFQGDSETLVMTPTDALGCFLFFSHPVAEGNLCKGLTTEAVVVVFPC